MSKFSREIKEIARATVEVARESDATAQVISDLKRFAADRDVDANMHPVALSAIAALLRRELLPSVDAFVENVIAEARDIADHYEARVTSAVPLNAGERAALATSLEKRLGGSVSLEEHADASLIGGLIVETDGWRFDASVKGKIHRLQQALSTSY